MSKYGLIHLKDTIYGIFGDNFIENRTNLDLKSLDEIQDKLKTEEYTDLKAVLSEYNGSLIVDQITQNENIFNNNESKI